MFLQQINVYPTRAITGKKKHEIHTELNRLKDEEEMLEDKLQQRKKQFHVMVNSIHRLQDLLDQEEEETEAMVKASVNDTIHRNKEEGLVESEDEDGEDNDGDTTAKDELNTSNVSSSPEDSHMEVS